VEVYYDGRGEMYFRGGLPQFVEDGFSCSSITTMVRRSLM
jgi:hypothetical protein